MKTSSSKPSQTSDFSVFWRLLKLFAPYWKWMALGILLSFITLLSNVTLLALSGWFITAMALAGVAGVHIDYFTPGAQIRGLAIIRTSSRYAERVVTHEATFRLLAKLRHWFYQHLEPLAPAGLQAYRSGDLLSRIRADIDTLENFYIRILSPMIIAVLGTLVFVFYLSFFHMGIAMIVLAGLVIAGVVIPLFINRLSKVPGERIIETSAELRTATVDSLQGMGELLIYGADKKQAETMTALSECLLKDQDTMAKYSGVSQGALGFFANIAMWLSLLIAIPMVTAQTLEPAHLTMLALLTLASFETILPLPLAFQMLPETLKAARRVFQLTDTPVPVADPETSSPKPKDFSIEFNDVSFRYADKGKRVLEGFNLSIPQGKKVAIVGHSGAGKSSLVNLLMRFWEPDSGEITFGSYPLHQYKGDDLRCYFGVISQHAHLFNSTIHGNLMLANPDASDEDLEEVCKVAQIHDFIISQPDGYQTWIGEAGLKLSGGQARRLSIARALLKYAPILILDEPGEGLDLPTEKALLDAVMKKADAEGQTVVLITHKQAGLEWVDEVVQLENGKIS